MLEAGDSSETDDYLISLSGFAEPVALRQNQGREYQQVQTRVAATTS
jgi:hypothetical protein